MRTALKTAAAIIVAIYLRLSRDENNGNLESMSISNQRDYLLSYAEERGVEDLRHPYRRRL